jgi:hypothetical protein
MQAQKTVQLAQIGESSENIYDYAKIGKWGKANTDLKQLNRAFGKYKSSSSATDRAFVSDLEKQINALSQSVSSRVRFGSMQTANSLTYKTAKFTADLNAPVPLEVTLLDYYGRELEIGSLFDNTNQVKFSVSKIHSTWNAVRSSVIDAEGGTEATSFDNLISKLEKPNSLKRFSKLAIVVLDKADVLETLFKSDVDGKSAD